MRESIVGTLIFLGVTILLGISRFLIPEAGPAVAMVAAGPSDIEQTKQQLNLLMMVFGILMAVGSEIMAGLFLHQAMEIWRDVDLKNHRELRKVNRRRHRLQDINDRMQTISDKAQQRATEAAEETSAPDYEKKVWETKIKRIVWLVFGLVVVGLIFAAVGYSAPVPSRTHGASLKQIKTVGVCT